MKKIHQFDTEGNLIKTWKSITKAAKYFGVDESSIRKAAIRRSKSQGFYWGKLKIAPFMEVENFPKVLVFDIETAPLTAFIWQLKTDYVNPQMLERPNWWVISWSAKWLFEDGILHDVVTPKEARGEDDSRLLQSIWNLIDEADVVISHNGKNFDHKILNMRWLLNEMPPPSPYREVDTLRSCKGLFSFPSYKLDYITKQLGMEGKLEHEGFTMWKKSILGEQDALDNMVKYNDLDVLILEELYLIIRPWIKNHPNFGVITESEVPSCRICGSSDLKVLEGQDYTTNLSKFETLRCVCGAVNKRRKSKLPLAVRKVLLSGMPA